MLYRDECICECVVVVEVEDVIGPKHIDTYTCCTRWDIHTLLNNTLFATKTKFYTKNTFLPRLLGLLRPRLYLLNEDQPSTKPLILTQEYSWTRQDLHGHHAMDVCEQVWEAIEFLVYCVMDPKEGCIVEEKGFHTAVHVPQASHHQ